MKTKNTMLNKFLTCSNIKYRYFSAFTQLILTHIKHLIHFNFQKLFSSKIIQGKRYLQKCFKPPNFQKFVNSKLAMVEFGNFYMFNYLYIPHNKNLIWYK